MGHHGCPKQNLGPGVKPVENHWCRLSFGRPVYVPGMVEVLGPWLVPVEAVVREPTAGARMKSMSPSSGEDGFVRHQAITCMQYICYDPKTSELTGIHWWRVWYPAGRCNRGWNRVLVVAGGRARFVAAQTCSAEGAPHHLSQAQATETRTTKVNQLHTKQSNTEVIMLCSSCCSERQSHGFNSKVMHELIKM